MRSKLQEGFLLLLRSPSDCNEKNVMTRDPQDTHQNTHQNTHQDTPTRRPAARAREPAAR